MGYTVIDPLSVLSTHLAESIKRVAYELFSRQEAKKMLDRVAVENAKVVEDLVPKLLPLATVEGFADIVTTGFAAVTVTVVDCAALPPGPVQDSM